MDPETRFCLSQSMSWYLRTTSNNVIAVAAAVASLIAESDSDSDSDESTEPRHCWPAESSPQSPQRLPTIRQQRRQMHRPALDHVPDLAQSPVTETEDTHPCSTAVEPEVKDNTRKPLKPLKPTMLSSSAQPTSADAPVSPAGSDAAAAEREACMRLQE
ncbi:uncharacterized protein M421DRAFT_420070 [Didymella exigua CBS 183.55]|uniref:Uncharacterized protein n=1 Tax=Didymella exigua CBS 183.55 TaxID=1150837 RepID=A0A6A5RMF4_9PLEO|nr:uncharacterized protein M421DRAFT_420070 [Didymella exigua CBS 183.55]KAF1928839.1 hypothetical protein M421DRAFT_420070 [Didymella exigua CBS 183.55]